MRRSSILAIVFAIVLTLSGAQAVLGQGLPTLEPGTKVDKSTSKAVVNATKAWVKNMNAADEAAITGMTPNAQLTLFQTNDSQQALAMLPNVMKASINLLANRNVRQLPDGRYAIDVSYSGFFGEHWYRSDRWVFIQQGDQYLFDGSAVGTDPLYVPKKHSKQQVDVTVAEDGTVSAGAKKIEATDIVFMHVTNASGQFILLGLFRGDEPIVMLPAMLGVDLFQGVYAMTPGKYTIVPILTDGSGQPVPGAKAVKLTVVAPATPEASPAASASATPGQ